MQWLEIAADAADTEALCAFLEDNGVSGLVIEDEKDIREFIEANREFWDEVDEDFRKAREGVSRVKFYLSDGINFTTVSSTGTKPAHGKVEGGRWHREPYSGPEGKANFRKVVIPQERGNAVSFPRLTAEFPGVTARYVRFRTERDKFYGYFFLDEIMVY